MRKESVIEISLLSKSIGLFRRNCQAGHGKFLASFYGKTGIISYLMNKMRKKEKK